MKVKKSVVFAAALACGILLAVPLGAAAASNYRMAENGPATREESARLNRTFLYLNIVHILDRREQPLYFFVGFGDGYFLGFKHTQAYNCLSPIVFNGRYMVYVYKYFRVASS